jgi:hypothetical protein
LASACAALGFVGQELGRAAEGVHHHRVVERGGDDLAGFGLGAHGAQVRLVGHCGVDARGAGDHRVGSRLRLEVDDVHVLQGQAVLVEEPGQREVRRRAGRTGRHGLALQVLDAVDAGLTTMPSAP